MTEASRPEDFASPEEALIELPRRNGKGEILQIRIRAIPREDIVALYGGQPSAKMDVDANAPLTEESIKDANERMEKIVRLGTIAPQVSFAEGEPGVPWKMVHPDNQIAWPAAILAHSSMTLPEEAQRLLTFRYVERGGAPVRE